MPKNRNKSSAQKPQVKESSTIDSKKKRKRKDQKPDGELKPPKMAKMDAKTEEDPLHYCREVVQELLSKKKENIAWPFYKPVDAELNPDYYDKISTPIDLSTIEEKLRNTEYSTVKEFEQDVSMMFRNCREYNDPDETIVKNANKLEKFFLARMSKMGNYTKALVQNLQKPHDMEVPKEAAPAAAAAPAKKVDSAAGGGEAAALDAKINSHADLFRKLKLAKAAKTEIDACLKEINAAKSEFKTATGLDWTPSMKTAAKPGSGGGDLSGKVAGGKEKGKKQEPKEKGKKATEEQRKDGNIEEKEASPESPKNSKRDMASEKGKKATEDQSKQRKDVNIEEKEASPESPKNSKRDMASEDGDEVPKVCTIPQFKVTKSVTKNHDRSELEESDVLSSLSDEDSEDEEGSSGEDESEDERGEFSESRNKDGEFAQKSKIDDSASICSSSESQATESGDEAMDDLCKIANKTTTSATKANEKNLTGIKEAGASSTLNKDYVKENKSSKAINKNGTTENKSRKAKATSQLFNSPLEELGGVYESSETPVPGCSQSRTKPVGKGKNIGDLDPMGPPAKRGRTLAPKDKIRTLNIGDLDPMGPPAKRKRTLNIGDLDPMGPPAKRGRTLAPKAKIRTLDDYPYTEVSEVFDTSILKSNLSDDKKKSVEIRLEEAVMQYDAKLEKLSSGDELAWLLYKKDTMGVDPTVILAGLDTGVSYKLNKAVTVVNKGNGHMAPVNEWNVVIGKKGINKSGGFNLTLGPLQEMENEDVAFQRKLFDEHIKEMLKEDEEDQSAAESNEEAPKTPSKRAGSPKKKKELPSFQEMSYRNLLQSGTSEGIEAHMYNASEKSFMMYYDEASTLFSQLYTSGGPGTAKRTHWLTTLLSFFSSQEARSAKVCKGSQRLPKASIQIYAVAQPLIFLDLFIKDRIDPAGLIDRLSLWVCRAVTVSLRTQKENLRTMKRQVLDVKKLLRTIEFIGRQTPNEWVFDAEAEEAIFELDDKLIEMEDGIDDADGVIKAMNAKAREKTYRGATREAAKRLAYELMNNEIELNDSVVIHKIITKTDVLKAMAISHASCYTFLQYKAAVDEKGDPSGSVKPVAAKAAFVTELDDWEKPIADYPKTFANVKRVYDSERDELEPDKINFDTLLKNDAYLRASSKKKFKASEEQLFFLRCLEFNGLGKIYFKNRPDKKKEVTFEKKVYSTIKFRPAADEEDLSGSAKETMTLLIESLPDFVPFK